MPQLNWTDSRWHLGEHPIHAGSALRVTWPDGHEEVCRIETADHGRRLMAAVEYHGVRLVIRVDDMDDVGLETV